MFPCVKACRGEQHDVPVTPCDAVDSDVQINETVVDACAVQTLPAGADFIMCYSVAEGEPSALCSENFPFPAPVTAALGQSNRSRHVFVFRNVQS